MIHSQLHEAARPPTRPRNHELDPDFDGFGSDAMEKDEMEIELEKIVFGDEKGFLDELKAHNKSEVTRYTDTVEEDKGEGPSELEDGGLEGLDDSAVRTIDSCLGTPFR